MNDFPNADIVAEHGGPAVYINPAGERSDITGIFQGPYTEMQLGNILIDGTKPTMFCLDEDVAGATHAGKIIVGVITYKISGIEPDGKGMTKLTLSKD